MKSKTHPYRYVCHVIFNICFLILNLIVLTYIGQRLLLSVDSDSLYLPNVYSDVFIDGFSLRKWVLSPAPCLFPDFILLTLVESISPSLEIGLILYGMAYTFLLGFLLYGLSRFENIRPIDAITAVLVPTLILNLLLATDSGLPLASVLLGPGRHAGSILVGATLIYLLFRILDRGVTIRTGIPFCALSCATVFSDISFIPQFLIPIILITLVYGIWGWIKWTTGSIIVVISVLSALIGRVLLTAFVEMEWLLVPDPQITQPDSWITLTHTIRLFGNDALRFMNIHPLLCVSVILWLIYSIAYVSFKSRLILKERKNAEFRSNPECYYIFWILFSLASFLCMILAAILSGLWMSSSEIRYIQPVFLYPFWTCIFACVRLRSQRMKRFVSALAAPTLIAALLVVLPIFKNIIENDFQFPYPEKVRFFDRIVRKHGLQYGYSNYWNAKYVTMLSKENVRVNQLANNLLPSFWIDNKEWFWKGEPSGKTGYPMHQFIITNGLSKEEIERRFGKPAKIERGSGMEIYIYNRPQDMAFRNFLRHFFLNEEYPDKAYRPQSPPPLQRFKPNGTQWNEKDNTIIPPTMKLIARFSPGVVGDTLEISADNNDRYDITFYCKDGRGALAPIEETLSVPQAKGLGLEVRYLKIPTPATTQTIDAIEIVPVQGDQYYSVGHVFIYFDPHTHP